MLIVLTDVEDPITGKTNIAVTENLNANVDVESISSRTTILPETDEDNMEIVYEKDVIMTIIQSDN